MNFNRSLIRLHVFVVDGRHAGEQDRRIMEAAGGTACARGLSQLL